MLSLPPYEFAKAINSLTFCLKSGICVGVKDSFPVPRAIVPDLLLYLMCIDEAYFIRFCGSILRKIEFFFDYYNFLHLLHGLLY